VTGSDCSATMDPGVIIRPYRECDRQQVREICYLTGYMGESAAWYWRDFQSFADIWTAYYTDEEPESSFVAVRSGRVVGYLLGCVDTARSPSPKSAMTSQIIRRLLFLRSGTAGFCWRAVLDVLRDRGVPSGGLEDARWPSHLHIDLLSEARGAGVGRALMHAWLGRLAGVASPGCHLATMAENENAIAFFERVGFRRLGPPTPIPGMRTREGARMHQQVMVRELSAA